MTTRVPDVELDAVDVEGAMEGGAFDRTMRRLMSAAAPDDLQESTLRGGKMIETGGAFTSAGRKEPPPLTPAERASAVRYSKPKDPTPSIPDLWSENGGQAFVRDALKIADRYNTVPDPQDDDRYRQAVRYLADEPGGEHRTSATRYIADYQRRQATAARNQPIADGIKRALMRGDKKAMRDLLGEVDGAEDLITRLDRGVSKRRAYRVRR